MRLTNAVKSLCTIEKIKPKAVKKNKDHRFTEVIATDGREFIVFDKKRDAFDYAVNVFCTTQDDPQFLKEIKWTGKSVKQYAEALVEREDVPHVISYDQYHKVRLPKNALAYRTL